MIASLRWMILLMVWGLACPSIFAQGRPTHPGPIPETQEPPTEAPTQPQKQPIRDGQIKPALNITQPNRHLEPNLLPVQAISSTGMTTLFSSEANAPVVVIRVQGSETAAIGDEVPYTIVVENRSRAKAHHVIARCKIPKNATVVKTNPISDNQKELEWSLGTLEPGKVEKIEVVFRPKEGAEEIYATAHVQYDHGEWLRTKIVKPGLTIKKFGPTSANLFETIPYRIEVTNTGKVPVHDLVVEDQLPPEGGLEHFPNAKDSSNFDPKNPQYRKWTIRTLAPGERQTLAAPAISKQVGEYRSLCKVSSGNTKADNTIITTIQEARLNVQLYGPTESRSIVKMSTPYQVVVNNLGTMPLNNVRVTCTLPKDAQYTMTTSGAELLSPGTIQWILPKLEPEERKVFNFSLSVPTPGQQTIQVSVRGNKGKEEKAEIKTNFDGVAGLRLDTTGTATASVGNEITYILTVQNTGTASARQVVAYVDLPKEVELKSAEPEYDIQQNRLLFRSREIPSRKNMTFKVTVLAKQKGDAEFKLGLVSTDLQAPVLHQKITRIVGEANPTTKPKDKDKPIGDGQIGSRDFNPIVIPTAKPNQNE